MEYTKAINKNEEVLYVLIEWFPKYVELQKTKNKQKRQCDK